MFGARVVHVISSKHHDVCHAACVDVRNCSVIEEVSPTLALQRVGAGRTAEAADGAICIDLRESVFTGTSTAAGVESRRDERVAAGRRARGAAPGSCLYY